MRKAILVMLLAGACSSAAAEVWVVVGKNEKFTAYADPATMRKEGSMVKMWNLFDYKTAQAGVAGKRYLCHNENVTMLQFNTWLSEAFPDLPLLPSWMPVRLPLSSTV